MTHAIASSILGLLTAISANYSSLINYEPELKETRNQDIYASMDVVMLLRAVANELGK